MGVAQVLTFSLQFLGSVVLARYLSLHEAGIYAAALAVVGVLSLIQTLGLQALIVREETLTPELSASAFTINALISIGLSALIALTSVWGGRFLGDVGVQRALSALALTPLFGIFAFLPSAVLERHGRFRELALIGTAGNLAGTIVSIVLVIDGFSFMTVAYAQWANQFVAAILMNVIGFQYVSLKVSFRAWRRIADFGLQMLAVTGISALSLRLSDVLLARFLGLSVLGLYSRASSVNGLLWTNIHLLIGRVMLVDYADLNRAGVPLRARYMQTIEMITVVLWPAFVGLAVLSGPFIRIIYGAKWVPAAPALSLLALASAVLVAITMTWEIFAATNQLRTQTRIEFIRSFLALGAFVVGCQISLTAAAAARIVDAVFALFLYRPYLNRMTATVFADFLSIYARSALLTVVAMVPSIALMTLFDWRADVPLAWLGASIVLGVLLWAAALALSRHPLTLELRRRAAT